MCTVYSTDQYCQHIINGLTIWYVNMLGYEREMLVWWNIMVGPTIWRMLAAPGWGPGAPRLSSPRATNARYLLNSHLQHGCHGITCCGQQGSPRFPQQWHPWRGDPRYSWVRDPAVKIKLSRFFAPATTPGPWVSSERFVCVCLSYGRASEAQTPITPQDHASLEIWPAHQNGQQSFSGGLCCRHLWAFSQGVVNF